MPRSSWLPEGWGCSEGHPPPASSSASHPNPALVELSFSAQTRRQMPRSFSWASWEWWDLCLFSLVSWECSAPCSFSPVWLEAFWQWQHHAWNKPGPHSLWEPGRMISWGCLGGHAWSWVQQEKGPQQMSCHQCHGRWSAGW